MIRNIITTTLITIGRFEDTILSASLFIFLFLSLGKSTVWPGIITLLVAIGLGVLAVVFPKSAGVIRFKTKSNRFVLSEVTSLSVKLLSVNQGIFKYNNVKRNRDFAIMQFEVGAIIKDIQAQNSGMKVCLVNEETVVKTSVVEIKEPVKSVKKDIFDDIPEL